MQSVPLSHQKYGQLILVSNICSMTGTNIVLWITDSRSTLDALKGNIWKPDKEIQILYNMIYRLVERGIRVIGIWTPSHCGALENNKADLLASRAISEPNLEHAKHPVPFSVVKTITKNNQVPILSYFHSHDEDIQKSNVSTRKAEVVLNQIRSNCSPLVRKFHAGGREYDPICKFCTMEVPEDVEHLFKHCPGRRQERQKYFGRESRKKSVDELCVETPIQVLGFLLDVGLLEGSRW